MPVVIRYPKAAKNRGPGYWLRFPNIWASRRKLRSDASNKWRKTWGRALPVIREVGFSTLLRRPVGDGFKFIIIGDTGEGDRSQYSLLPLIRAVNADFMIINGDLAYPAGRVKDYEEGFFKPYQGLDIPIWAVPGNHEYYSKKHGEEFVETFCTDKWARRWSDYDLPFIKQPGTYWALSDSEARLVVIALDSGKKADLDGKGKKHRIDDIQLSWFEEQLRLAQRNGKDAIVLFHIPGLANQKHVKKTHLTVLHQIIARYSCVRLVVTGHVHNYQRYAANTFRQYLEDRAPSAQAPQAAPEYVVSGHGGAYLSSTDFKGGAYQTVDRYPSTHTWTTFARIGAKTLLALRLGQSVIAKIAGAMERATKSDMDAGGLLSFMLVEVGPTKIDVFPIFMDDVRLLFAGLPDGTIVDIKDKNPPVDMNVVDFMKQTPISF